MIGFNGVALLALAWLIASPISAQPTQDVFARTKHALVQVRIIDTAGGAKGAIGSGFVATKDGHIVTNYHVISELTQHPGKYRAEWLDTFGKSGVLELLDIDIAHDLAVLSAPGREKIEPLPIELSQPSKGKRIYSLGNPFDLGPTIVEGTFNGLIEKSLYRHVHLTASINPGMSGGPAVNGEGAVIGVNVASAGEQIGFLVPAEFVNKLLERQRSEPLKKFKAEINRQLAANQDEILARLEAIGFASAKLGSYSVPGAIGETISCWSSTDQAKKRVINATTLTCQSDDSVFVSSELSTGALRYSHSLRRARNISSMRFWTLNTQSIGFDWEFLSGDEDEVTNFECRTDLITHAKLKRKTRLCLRRYKDYPDIYDLVLRQISLNHSRTALASTLVLTGVSDEKALSFAQSFIERTQ